MPRADQPVALFFFHWNNVGKMDSNITMLRRSEQADRVRSTMTSSNSVPKSAHLREIWIAELLCSRLCHDVISPVGAVSNGLELMSEFGNGTDNEAFALVVSSARQAVEKLSFFRVAYGQSGMRQVGLSFQHAAALLEPVVSGPRVVLEWPKSQQPETPAPAPGAIKFLLNLALLTADTLPRGGTIKISVTPGVSQFALSIDALAADARITDELAAALDGRADLQDLTPRTAQGAFTRYLALRLKTEIRMTQIKEGDENVGLSFTVSLPASPASERI